jgi:hypothetical protein
MDVQVFKTVETVDITREVRAYVQKSPFDRKSEINANIISRNGVAHSVNFPDQTILKKFEASEIEELKSSLINYANKI